MSELMNKCINYVEGVAHVLNVQIEIRETWDALVDAEREKCGSCRLWMTSDCVPERKLGLFRSMNDIACGLFEIKAHQVQLIEERKAAYEAAKQKLNK